MFKKFFTDKNGNIILAQKPNTPILIWTVATIVKRFVNTSALYAVIDSIGTIFIVVWSVMEIATGDTLFRRALGFTVLLATAYSRLA